MTPLTIHLSGFRSSYEPEYRNIPPEQQNNSMTKATAFIYERQSDNPNFHPEDSYLALYCNGVEILQCYINNSMENQRETVWVDDEASCLLRILNTTSYNSKWADYAIWYMNYTVYAG